MRQLTRYEYGFTAAGKCLQWVGRHPDQLVTKESALELVQLILAVIGLRIKEG